MFKDSTEGYLITDLPAIRREFEGRIQQLQTREMKLETLGIFPLPKQALPLMTRKLNHAGLELVINPLFMRSQIPIFADEASTCAYIPAEGTHICRYFYDLWHTDSAGATPGDPILEGFAVLASYAGI